MNRCILHVGMPKTGTSSIQKSLAGFADSKFLYYPDPNGRTNHTPEIYGLVGSVAPSRARKQRELGREAASEVPTSAIRSRFDQAIRSLGGRNLIVSGEGIMSLPAEALQELSDYLQSRKLAVEIVAYIRPFAAYVTSLARATKGGSLKTLNLERRTSSYRSEFEKIDQAFGRENVRLWKFDPQSFTSDCVVQDFCAKLSIDFPADRVVRVNESLSREAVALLYTYRHMGEAVGSISMTEPQRSQLVQELKDIGNTKFRFSPDLLRPMLANNSADIEWMEARLGQSLDEDLGEHRHGDVREDWDLLEPNPEVVKELLQKLGKAAPPNVKGETPEEVALLVHALREKRGSWRGALKRAIGAGQRSSSAAPSMPATPLAQDRQTPASDVIASMQRTNSELLNGIPQKDAEALVANVWKHMSETLATKDEGVVAYAGLGHFRVTKVEKEVDGKRVSQTRIVFRPARAE